MQYKKTIHIVEKPNDVSWEDIHECLWESHKKNRQNNIIMSFPALSGYQLKEKIENGHGKLFIALDGSRLIGTAAFTIVKNSTWFCQEEYAYLCLASILPIYAGSGIYRKLCDVRENECKKIGLNVFVFETHEQNERVIDIQKKNGFRLVGYKRCKDGHHNVILAKWSDEPPFSKIHCNLRFRYSQFRIWMFELINIVKDKLCRR